MQFSTIRLIIIKELREILRDRRTLFLMIGVPVLLYPALFILMEQVMLFGQGNLTTQAARVGVHQSAEAALSLTGSPELQLIPMEDADAGMVISGRFDAVIRVDSAEETGSRALQAEVLYDGSRDR